MDTLPVYYVDAFTATPFTGNPAAVCLAHAPLDELRMQRIAFEIGFSETAFTWPEGDGRRLRWFTPREEADLCGHATLATAHVLHETSPGSGDAVFATRSGTLTVTPRENGYRMDFPAEPAAACPCPPVLPEALGQFPLYTARNRLDYLVELPSADDVRTLQADFSLLARLHARGLMVTAAADLEGYDFVSRFFAPGTGIDEDPVTGSAHCCLGPYWAKRTGKNVLKARQLSHRGGDVGMEMRDDGRVLLSGACVTVLHGELTA